MPKINLIMPMAGGGTRFKKEGMMLPKPLIELDGHPFFFWATQSIVKYIQNDITISFNLFTKTLLCLLFTTLLKSIPVAVLIPIENSTVIAVKNTFKESKVTSLCEAIPSF